MMNLSKLFIIHAIITFAAGLVLILAPGFIPQAIGLRLDPDAYFLAYLLGAAEISMALLSWMGRNLKHQPALRVISWTLIVFHALSAAVELLAFIQGVNVLILVNIAVRITAITFLSYHGLLTIPISSRRT